MKIITLIRGLPGSGKSFLSGSLREGSDGTLVMWVEADDYFYDDYGNYVFNANELTQAHEHCQQRTRLYSEQDADVVVANTFTTLSEMKPYYLMAKELGAKLNVITCQGDFGSEHDVPQETYDKMKKRFFHGDVIAELDKLYGV